MELNTIVATTVQQIALEQLRDAILTGRLAPGQRLAEQELATQFQISRTPIREALRQLELEMLVTHVPRHGFEVVRPNRKTVEEVYRVRVVLEGLAARLTALNIDAQGLRALERAIDGSQQGVNDSNNADVIYNNADFHMLIARYSGNQVLSTMVQTLQGQVRIIRQLFFTIPQRPAEAVREHRAVYDAIAQRNPDLAERLAIEHMNHAADAILNNYIWSEPVDYRVGE